MTDAPGAIEWLDDHRFRVGSTRFIASYLPLGHRDGELVVVKERPLIEKYAALTEAHQPRRIVELGIKDGGSTALLCLLAQPTALLAIDLATSVTTELEAFVASSAADRLHLRLGTDQGDAEALSSAVREVFAEDPIDLVVDDASHELALTRASFETLFPSLRPGGCYVIEDWSSELITASILDACGPTPDPRRRLAGVLSIVDVLNDPAAELPPRAVEVMSRVHERAQGDAAVEVAPHVHPFFAQLVVAAAGAVDEVPEVSLDSSLPRRPLADLAVELAQIAAVRPDVVAQVTIDQEWVLVRRGRADLRPGELSLAALWHDAFGYLGG